MQYKYNIDSIKYRILPEKDILVINGWCLNIDNESFEYELEINGQKVNYEIVRITRRDVKRKYPHITNDFKSGFRLIYTSNGNIKCDEVKLYVKDHQQKVLLKTFNQSMIKKNSETEKIEYVIDFYTKNHNGTDKFIVGGWAHSLTKKEPVNFTLTDDKGNLVEYTLNNHNRDDLLKLKIVEEYDKYCGFTIEFFGQKDTDYFLILETSDEKIKIDLNKVLISKFVRIKALVKSYILSMSIENIKKGFTYLKKYGFKKFIKRALQGPNAGQISYHEWFENHKVSSHELDEQKKVKFEYEPKISIIVPTYNTPIKFLREMINSVIEQSYSNWELCIADGSEGNKVLENELEKYAKQDSRIKYTLLDKNYGIAGNTNGALKLATGDYVGLFDHDDLLTPDALFEVVKALQNEKYDILYTDEDKVNSDLTEFMDPNFKPDYSPDLFCSHNYITHFFVVKHEIITKVGGFRSEFDGSQDYDLMFRCIENSNSIYHIPKILYHWRMHAASTAENPASKMYCYEAGKKAIEEHYKRVGINAVVEHKNLWGMYHTIYSTLNDPLVSIIIPNKDQKNILDRCIQSLYEKNSYKNFEIIIVENNSETKEIFEYYNQIQEQHSNIKVVQWNGEFNYSAINNYGVTFAKGEYILLLNNDTEVISETAISELLGCCMRDDVGIVGAKLLYEDNTVQHAGVVIGFGGFAGHVFTGIHKDDYGYMVRAQINCNYSAVTAACMMIDRKCFEAVGGLTEDFKVGLNDIDFCLKVRELGKLVVYNAHSLWYHYESKSRGYENTPEKLKRFEGEVNLFQSRWKDILINGDPYYNKNFVIELGPFMLG